MVKLYAEKRPCYGEGPRRKEGRSSSPRSLLKRSVVPKVELEKLKAQLDNGKILEETFKTHQDFDNFFAKDFANAGYRFAMMEI